MPTIVWHCCTTTGQAYSNRSQRGHCRVLCCVLSARSAPLLVKYLDSVDRVVSARVTRKRPWLEVALTSLLCDVLDDDTSGEYPLEYTLEDLRAAVREAEPLLDIGLTIETHEYSPAVERWVTQADLGIVIRYQDGFDTSRSYEAAWLLQAKRL